MKKLFIFYAILLPVYPVLFLYNYNNGMLKLGELWLPVALTLLGAGILLGLLRLIFRKLDTAAALTAFWGIGFFSYGHLLGAEEIVVRNAIWVWLTLLALGTLFILWQRRRLPKARPALFVLAAALVAFTLVEIAWFEVARTRLNALYPETADPVSLRLKAQATASAKNQVDTSSYPDIYYIILDGYARPDVFEELYGESNQRFVNFLEQKGFHIEKNSHTNYFMTVFALGAALDMRFLDYITEKAGRGNPDLFMAYAMTHDAALPTLLREKGYKLINNSPGITPEITCDIDVSAAKPTLSSMAVRPIPPFAMVVINMTPLRLIESDAPVKETRPPQPEVDHGMYLRRRLHAQAFFKNFEALPELNSPRFIFAHLSLPHPPFVFNRDGTPDWQTVPYNMGDGVAGIGDSNMKQEYYLQHYAEQYLFVSDKIQQTLGKLLAAKSRRPKVIILQSDHGPAAYYNWREPAKSYLRERLSILNAFYFSDGARLPLYDSMTPVNSFRIICNHYFKTNYPLLKDRSFVAKLSTPYDFVEVTDKIRKLPKSKLPRPKES